MKIINQFNKFLTEQSDKLSDHTDMAAKLFLAFEEGYKLGVEQERIRLAMEMVAPSITAVMD